MKTNALKQAMNERRRTIGAWLTTGSVTVTEIFSGTGFDWLLIDMEHSPNDLLQIIEHMRACGDRTEIIVRIPWNDPVQVKRVLDIGVRNLMFPYVQSAEEAQAAVAATRYPPHGIRGVAGTTRATDYGRAVDFAGANDNIGVVVQIETADAVAACAEISAVEGVDGVFIGPNDLAANMGHLGNPAHSEVRKAMLDCAATIGQAGKAAGTLAYAPEQAASPYAEGFHFIGAVFDAGLIVRGAREALADYTSLRDNT